MNHHYNKRLRSYAQELRTETVSKAEKRLWKVLSKKQQGVGFKRQRPIFQYIVDFYAQEIKLIIEIDGNSHRNKCDYDRNRQTHLELLGNTVLRFSEGDVMQNLDLVLDRIQHVVFCLKKSPPPVCVCIQAGLIPPPVVGRALQRGRWLRLRIQKLV